MDGELAVEQRGGSIDNAVRAVMDSGEVLGCIFQMAYLRTSQMTCRKRIRNSPITPLPVLPLHIFGLDENIEVVDWGADELEILLEP